jgi:hypothetical protein
MHCSPAASGKLRGLEVGRDELLPSSGSRQAVAGQWWTGCLVLGWGQGLNASALGGVAANAPGENANAISERRNLPLSFTRLLNDHTSIMRWWVQILSASLLPIVCLTGCATSSAPESAPGPSFPRAQNDRVVVLGAVLQPVTLDTNYYLRWTFSIRPTQAIGLGSIRIDDVSGPSPLQLVNDVAPQLENGQWNEISGLMDLSSPGVQWLFEPGSTVRVFRLTFAWLDGRNDVLEQSVPYSNDAKKLMRATLRR